MDGVRRPRGAGALPQMNKDKAASQTLLSDLITLTCECFSGCVCVGLIRAQLIDSGGQFGGDGSSLSGASQ